MRLIKDWKSAWRWYSIHAMLWPAAVVGAWTFLPESLQDQIPHRVMAWLGVSVLLSGIVGRLIDQDNKK